MIDAPVPVPSGPNLLVEVRASVVSAGTERMLVEFGRSNLLQKARAQPDKVSQVLNKMRTDGVLSTLEAVRSKLAEPIPLGYCSAGIVVETGTDSGGFASGDRVVTNGPHAEYVRVPRTLAAKIPNEVSFEDAAFAPLAAIGLQGLRLAEPTLGETFVVMGLGLIGLLTVQLLRANGCRVIGIDRDMERVLFAESFGAIGLLASKDVADRVVALTGVGADAVLLTLASDANDPIRQAAAMSRKRGRLVLVGVTGLELSRQDFYEKELSFTVSCSYGPGRHDSSYEHLARDYPLPFVRWTEQRNFEAVLALMASGQLDPAPLITHRFPFEDAPTAYDLMTSDQPSLGIVLEYGERPDGTQPAICRQLDTGKGGDRATASGCIGVIGAGNFAVRTLLPVLAKQGARLRVIASDSGTSASLAAQRFGFERAVSDLDAVFEDSEVDTIFILTRHDSHAHLVRRGLEAGKHVFVEKPLAINEVELDEVLEVAAGSDGNLMVGFNRRFAPLARRAKEHLNGRVGPLTMIATINAGPIPRDHWTQELGIGGGRIIGEACHWMDLARFLVGEEIAKVEVMTAFDARGHPIDDIAHLSMQFRDGSTAVVHYLSSGAKTLPKERVECLWEGKTIVIDNWRRLRLYGIRGPLLKWPSRMDKGHLAEVEAWLDAVRTGSKSPISLDELAEVSRWSIRAGLAARTHSSV